jgi:hypothetical protein
MMRIAYLIVVLLSLRTVEACSFDAPMPFDEVVENARHIAVVRILSQELTERVEFDRPVIAGRVQIIEVLQGEPSFSSIEFSNSVCGGVRLDVGQYYVVFTAESGPVLRLVPADNSLISLAGEYIPEFSTQNYKNRFLKSVRGYINGEITAQEIDPFPLIERNGTVKRIDCKACMPFCPKNGA